MACSFEFKLQRRGEYKGGRGTGIRCSPHTEWRESCFATGDASGFESERHSATPTAPLTQAGFQRLGFNNWQDWSDSICSLGLFSCNDHQLLLAIT
jgi:hypothetical protein